MFGPRRAPCTPRAGDRARLFGGRLLVWLPRAMMGISMSHYQGPGGQGPYFIPAGAPPGTPLLMEEDRPPEAVYYFRVYAVVMLLMLLSSFGMGLYVMLGPLLSGASGASATGESVIGLIIVGFSFLVMVPHAIVLFAGRAKWAYTLGVILIGLNMLWNTCCLPITIPLLVVWLKPETKKWYGVG